MTNELIVRRLLSVLVGSILLLSSAAHGELIPIHKTKSVEQWLTELQSDAEALQANRLEQMRCLGSYGEEALKAVPALRKLLASPDQAWARHALEAIVRIHQDKAKHALPKKSEEEWLKSLESGEDPLQALPALEYTTTDKSVGLLAQALANQDPVIACFAAVAVGQSRVRATAGAKAFIAPLIKLTESGNMYLAEKAVVALGSFVNKGNDGRDAARPAVPALIATLRRGDPLLVFESAWALCLLGPQAADAGPALVEVLKKNSPLTSYDGLSSNEPRRMLVQALGSIHSSDKDAQAAVIKMLTDKDAEVRNAACLAVREMGAAADAVEPLLANLKDGDSKVRSRAAAALGTSGDNGKPVVETLTAALEDTDREVRTSAGLALQDLARFAVISRTAKELPMGVADKTLDLGGGVKLEMMLIPAGKFLMGSPAGEKDRKDNEGPQHEVAISKAFYMGKYVVTQEQYQQVMRTNSSDFRGNNLPVEGVTWEMAQEFCKKINASSAQAMRLPTEAEWEYACRAGTSTRYYSGDSEEDLKRVAWCWENSNKTPHPVGQKEPNRFGLYDMHGNVFQWCQDWWSDYKADAVVDPQGPEQSDCRVLRGGFYDFGHRYCRAAYRTWGFPGGSGSGFGFRVVMPAAKTP